MCPHSAEKASLSSGQPPSLTVIGNFDGVHTGHRAVLAQGVTLAERSELVPLVLTFHPHPSIVLGKANLPALTALERKLELIARHGSGIEVVVEPFTPELARSSPEEFVQNLLLERLCARKVLVGEDFRFGRGRSGDFETLVQLGQRWGFQAHSAALEKDDKGPISSTRIRNALELGDVAEAERLLGRPHALSAVVARGDGRGRSIGVPTANLIELSEALPPRGVYAVLVDHERTRGSGFVALGAGVANLGVRPTVGAGPSFEVHIFDFSGDLYGARLRVHLVARLRDEQKFASLDQLVGQIERDMAQARRVLAERSPDPQALGAWY